MEQTITNEEIITAWNCGETIKSGAMGGMGSSYEQPIQNLTYGLLSYFLKNDTKLEQLDDDSMFSDEYDEIVKIVFSEDINNVMDGMTGAQVGAAKSTAYQFLKNGYSETMKKLPANRLIYIKKN